MFTLPMFDENKWEGTYEIEEISCSSESFMSKSVSFQSLTSISASISAVVEVRKLTENLEILSKIGTGKWQVIVEEAHKALQTAMTKLEEEFIQVIIQNKKGIKLKHIPLHFIKGYTTTDESAQLVNDGTADDHVRKVNLDGESERCAIDLVHPDVVPDLRSIADLMCATNYGENLCKAFISVRKEALDEQFDNLGLKEVCGLHVGGVYLLGQNDLVEMINKWCLAMKIIIQIFLVSEKNLCDQIFGEFGPNGINCFLEIATPLLLHLLNTGVAIAERPHEQGNSSFLFQMHDVLVNLLPDVNSLFFEEDGSSIRMKFQQLLDKLTGLARGMLVKFGIYIMASQITFPDGRIHCSTEYVMSYIIALAKYVDTFNVLVESQGGVELVPLPAGIHSPTPSLFAGPDDESNANRTVASNYGGDFCREVIDFCKKVWDEHLVTLDVNKFASICDILPLQGPNLVKIMKVWSEAIQIIVQDYLASEQIFSEFESTGTNFFMIILITALLHLLLLSKTMTDRHHKPQDLFVLLDMCEVLVGLLPEINSLFPEEEVESFVGINFHTIIRNLRDSATAVVEFENSLTTTNVRNWVHQLTKDVITKISTSLDNSGVKLLVGKHGAMQQRPSTSFTFSPMATYMRAVVSTLESDLATESELYKDVPLQHLFLMNNIHYMIEKVREFKLECFLGDEWVTQHTEKFQHYATRYQMATWSPLLSLLTDEGIASAEGKYVQFNLAFAEVYKRETGWLVPDLKLREDLRNTILQKLIPQYYYFTSRHPMLSYKHISYTAEDLRCCISHLFEGSGRRMCIASKAK
ncbi:Exocyst complex subunit Exo70, C-terminal [Dillenia turbinata]|uniref:Exocyst subunit Exo70 family protein n=1 Tax=Dillenia turbinata TaxID=194707 RepID=A0AAN8V0A2_9MAGN